MIGDCVAEDDEEEYTDDDFEGEDEDESFVVPPAPNGYVYTGVPSLKEMSHNDYVCEIQQMCEEGGDPNWSQGKKYTTDVCLAFTPEQVLQMQGRLYEKFPPLNSVASVELADQLAMATHRASRKYNAHDPKIGLPLYNHLTKILEASKAGNYETAFNHAEGILFAIAGNATRMLMHGLAYCTSRNGDFNLDLTALMVVAIAHVCLHEQPDPMTAKGMCYDSVLARVRDINCPGDEPELYEKFKSHLELLVSQRMKTAQVLILADDEDGTTLPECTLKDLTDAWNEFTSKYGSDLE